MNANPNRQQKGISMAKPSRTSELEAAKPVTPVEALFEDQATAADDAASKAVADKVEAVTPPKPSRKATLKTATAIEPADSPPDYAALGVAESDIPKFERLRLRFADLGRRTTSQVFECGEVVHELHLVAPDQDTFAKLSKEVLGLSRKGAENYERVYRYLEPYRARLVKVAMIASALYDLAGQEPGKIEEVLAVRESGVSLTGKQIKAMLGIEGKAPASPDDGGPEGLKAAVAVKTASAASELFETLQRMLRELHIALEPHHVGREINKGKAINAVMHDARLAGGLIESLVYAAKVPGKPFPAGVVHVMPVEENKWSGLRRILYDMGSAEGWPKDGKSGAWLAETVVPQFEWALGPTLADKARKVLEERAAAAEAARVNAEADKERAKADAKKARAKAKLEQAKADKRSAREAKVAAKLAATMNGVLADMAGNPSSGDAA